MAAPREFARLSNIPETGKAPSRLDPEYRPRKRRTALEADPKPPKFKYKPGIGSSDYNTLDASYAGALPHAAATASWDNYERVKRKEIRKIEHLKGTPKWAPAFEKIIDELNKARKAGAFVPLKPGQKINLPPKGMPKNSKQ